MHICPKCHSKMYDGDYCMNCGYRPRRKRKSRETFDHIESRSIKSKVEKINADKMQGWRASSMGLPKLQRDTEGYRKEARTQKHIVFYVIFTILILFWVLKIINLFLSKF